jgi:cell division transport system permease protein
MSLANSITRAARSMREEARLHLVAISSLTIAFLGLGLTLLVSANVESVADAWGRSARISVFLRDGAAASEIEELRMAIEGLPEVNAVDHLTAAEAREGFLADGTPEEATALRSIPADAFPASLEVELNAGVAASRSAEIGERIAQFSAVDEVETYQGWFGRLESLLSAGRNIAIGLALLVLLSVLLVVGNTIRLAVAGRKDEIEVMKLCGADDAFVRGPFLVEGGVQGFAAAFLSMSLLTLGFLLLRDHLDATLAALAGVRTVFLPPLFAVGVLVAGTLAGVLGSALSLRRYLTV